MNMPAIRGFGIRFWLLLLLCLIPILGQTTPGDTALPAFSAQYKLTRNGFAIGETHASLQARTDGTFLYEVRTDPSGILAWLTNARMQERTSWTMQGEELLPLQYAYQRVIGNRERSVRQTFDWKQGVVRADIGGKSWEITVPDGTLDKLLVQLALMLDLQAQSRDLEYRIVDDGKLKTYRFRIIGHERITTPMGDFDTLKVARIQESRERSTVLWCAPELRYLPVRIDQVEDGVNYSMSVRSVQGLGNPPVS